MQGTQRCPGLCNLRTVNINQSTNQSLIKCPWGQLGPNRQQVHFSKFIQSTFVRAIISQLWCVSPDTVTPMIAGSCPVGPVHMIKCLMAVVLYC